MVQSLLNDKINYPEIKAIPSTDVKEELDLYQIEVMNIEIVIAIGTPSKKFEKSNVIFFPIYLVEKTKKCTQIGLYEIYANIFPTMYDPYDNDLQISNFSDPLIFSYIDDIYLNDRRLKPDNQLQFNDFDMTINDNDDNDRLETLKYKSSKSNILKIPPNRQNLFVMSDDSPNYINILDEETEHTAREIRQKYHVNDSDTWIQKYMKNVHYDIKDVESNGDCFFATIREAFQSIGQVTTVSKLRQRLSETITQDLFDEYKELYNSTHSEIKTNKIKLKDAKLKLQANIKIFKETDNMDDKTTQLANCKEMKTFTDNLKNEIKLSSDFIKDVIFMKGISNLQQMQQYILTNNFWADNWAISSLEGILNVKLILLSTAEYTETEASTQIIQCGFLNEEFLENNIYNPEFYIILEYTGNHFKLVTYKNKSIFSFKEIPYDIKTMILDKCLELNSGAFSHIPDFMHLKNSSPQIVSSSPNVDILKNVQHDDLYDDNIIFAFNINSARKKQALPGRGTGGEIIPKTDLKSFSELHAIPFWRNKLSNMWVQEFTLNGKKWSSVEHYYQASKYIQADLDFFNQFSLDSGSELSRDIDMLKAISTNKSGIVNGKLIRPKGIHIDDDFYGKRCEQVIYDAQMAKFSQNPDLRSLLLSTLNAKLTHTKHKNPNVVFTELMKIRLHLKNH